MSMGPGGPFMMRPAVVHQFPMMEQSQQSQPQQQPINGMHWTKSPFSELQFNGIRV